MRWTKEFRKRKHFNVWQIPTRIRRANELKDGDRCLIEIKLDHFKTREWVVLTSGGEFRIPNEHAQQLSSVALNSIAAVVEFELLPIASRDSHEEEFRQQVAKAKRLKSSERRRLAEKMSKFPRVSTVTSYVYKRNQYVAAEVLERSGGRCEDCGRPAPFKRAADGSPYLEVHHKIGLADGGEDTVENAVAVCPNCHRKAHYG